MGKSTRSVYSGRTMITGHTVVGDMLEWAARMCNATSSAQSPSRGPALRCPTFEPLPRAYFLGPNLAPTHWDRKINLH